ncbi:hypothetical protein BZA77DRAFT_369397 [Pyronema omphalodes]|nr:hypothetical protein BZA77DRAFT_369397 [Pyronema omphalodes]
MPHLEMPQLDRFLAQKKEESNGRTETPQQLIPYRSPAEILWRYQLFDFHQSPLPTQRESNIRGATDVNRPPLFPVRKLSILSSPERTDDNQSPPQHSHHGYQVPRPATVFTAAALFFREYRDNSGWAPFPVRQGRSRGVGETSHIHHVASEDHTGLTQQMGHFIRPNIQRPCRKEHLHPPVLHGCRQGRISKHVPRGFHRAHHNFIGAHFSAPIEDSSNYDEPTIIAANALYALSTVQPPTGPIIQPVEPPVTQLENLTVTQPEELHVVQTEEPPVTQLEKLTVTQPEELPVIQPELPVIQTENPPAIQPEGPPVIQPEEPLIFSIYHGPKKRKPRRTAEQIAADKAADLKRKQEVALKRQQAKEALKQKQDAIAAEKAAALLRKQAVRQQLQAQIAAEKAADSRKKQEMQEAAIMKLEEKYRKSLAPPSLPITTPKEASTVVQIGMQLDQTTVDVQPLNPSTKLAKPDETMTDVQPQRIKPPVFRGRGGGKSGRQLLYEQHKILMEVAARKSLQGQAPSTLSEPLNTTLPAIGPVMPNGNAPLAFDASAISIPAGTTTHPKLQPVEEQPSPKTTPNVDASSSNILPPPRPKFESRNPEKDEDRNKLDFNSIDCSKQDPTASTYLTTTKPSIQEKTQVEQESEKISEPKMDPTRSASSGSSTSAVVSGESSKKFETSGTEKRHRDSSTHNRSTSPSTRTYEYRERNERSRSPIRVHPRDRDYRIRSPVLPDPHNSRPRNPLSHRSETSRHELDSYRPGVQLPRNIFQPPGFAQVMSRQKTKDDHLSRISPEPTRQPRRQESSPDERQRERYLGNQTKVDSSVPARRNESVERRRGGSPSSSRYGRDSREYAGDRRRSRSPGPPIARGRPPKEYDSWRPRSVSHPRHHTDDSRRPTHGHHSGVIVESARPYVTPENGHRDGSHRDGSHPQSTRIQGRQISISDPRFAIDWSQDSTYYARVASKHQRPFGADDRRGADPIRSYTTRSPELCYEERTPTSHRADRDRVDKSQPDRIHTDRNHSDVGPGDKQPDRSKDQAPEKAGGDDGGRA